MVNIVLSVYISIYLSYASSWGWPWQKSLHLFLSFHSLLTSFNPLTFLSSSPYCTAFCPPIILEGSSSSIQSRAFFQCVDDVKYSYYWSFQLSEWSAVTDSVQNHNINQSIILKSYNNTNFIIQFLLGNCLCRNYLVHIFSSIAGDLLDNEIKCLSIEFWANTVCVPGYLVWVRGSKVFPM